jgi:hypothetical protein
VLGERESRSGDVRELPEGEGGAVRSFLHFLAKLLGQPRVIFDREGKTPYLSRWYILGRPRMADGSDPIDEYGNPRKEAIFPTGVGVYLHRFHRSDSDGALHNHPWRWSRALILAGGYSEERREWRSTDDFGRVGDFRVVRHERRPGAWLHIDADDYHRVDLLESDSWSLFIAGPKVASWGFWDRTTGITKHWRNFIADIRGSAWDGRKQ